MESLQTLLIWIHVGLGFTGLFAFWFPVFSRKGGTMHRRMGKLFVWSAYGVLSAAALTVTLKMYSLWSHGYIPSLAHIAWAFAIFLGYLTLVTAVILDFGLTVLRHKADLTALRTPLRVTLAVVIIAASLTVVGWAWYWQPENAVLLYSLSPIGLIYGSGMLRVMSRAKSVPRQWLLEHLSAMLACGIAFHTAFAVLGASSLFTYNLSGWIAVIPWVLPTLLGVPAIALWSRHYRQRTPATMTS